MDQKRRKFLKILLVGSGVLLAGKIFGSRILDFFFPDSKTTKDFENFRVSENKGELTISDQSGEEIFIIDKGK